jgi:hypothetical protein
MMQRRKHPIEIYFMYLENKESIFYFPQSVIYLKNLSFFVQIIITYYIKQTLKFKHSLHRIKNNGLNTKNSDVENLF